MRPVNTEGKKKVAIARLFLEIAKYCQSWFVLFSKSIKIEFYNLVIFLIRLSEFNENMNMGSNKSLLLSTFTKHFIALELYLSMGTIIWHRVAILNVCIYAKVTFQRHHSVKL